MKKINSLPENEAFFANYIWLVKTLNIAGYGGQIISALTEIGGIYVAAYLSLLPILADYTFYAAAVIAVLGTAIIEIGLRHAIPHSVDAILYRRFSGLRLAITIFVWTLTVLLLTASAVLSFRNSSTIVENMTAGEKEKAIAGADSLLRAEQYSIDSIHSLNMQQIDSTYRILAESEAAAEAANVAAAERVLKNWKNRQWREKTVYGTQIDNARAELEKAKAGLAAATSKLTREKASKIEAAKAKHEASRAEAKARHNQRIEQAKADQSGKVSEYGGGLAYFTIICLVILITSITINRIVIKGSGIKEQVEISQYDVLPNPFIAAISAFSHRIRYLILSRVTAFDDKTPSLNLPESVREIYDPAEVKSQRARLKIEEGEDSEYIVRRKRIKPFGSAQDAEAQHKEENPLPFYEVNKRLRDYKKRVASLKQKAKAKERKGKTPTARTLKAIQNNEEWVNYWQNYKKNHYE